MGTEKKTVDTLMPLCAKNSQCFFSVSLVFFLNPNVIVSAYFFCYKINNAFIKVKSTVVTSENIPLLYPQPRDNHGYVFALSLPSTFSAYELVFLCVLQNEIIIYLLSYNFLNPHSWDQQKVTVATASRIPQQSVLYNLFDSLHVIDLQVVNKGFFCLFCSTIADNAVKTFF